ncbi:hypothetical protein FGIG_07127 [Fasciola gigantica]|uniref:Uncharacterized protein n=1 Tax=Fasciola gigantica TaxID=46835 RepID=A0A504YF10_FASGI|nr:hypothetical protein FGIG_07127 [Fasciola gigantica]
MDLITEHTSVDSTDGYGPETRYLINTVGDILRTYVTELVIKRPTDPIDYLARCLKHHAEMEQIISAELMLELDEQQPNPSESTEPSSLSIEINHPSFVKAELQDHTPEEMLAEKIMQETAEDEMKPGDTEESNENVVHLVKDDMESSGQNEVDDLGEIASNGEDTDTIGERKVDTSNALQDNTEMTMDETMVADSLDFDDVQPYASEMVDPDEEIPEGSENDAGNVDTNA